VTDTHLDAQTLFEETLHLENPDEVYEVAKKLERIDGWEEEARVLATQAQRLRREEWLYDEAKGN